LYQFRLAATDAEKADVIFHRRRAGKGDGVRTLLHVAKNAAEFHARSGRNHGLVRFYDIDESTEATEFAGNNIASDLGAAEEDSLPAHLVDERLHDGFSDVLLRHDGDGKTFLLDGGAGRRSDGNDVQRQQAALGNPELLHAIEERMNAVDAGKYEIFVLADKAQGVVHAFIGARRTNFDEWDLHHLGAFGSKEVGERTRLFASARD